MYNFEHEVADIRDRYLRYFLASDYFHDGCIEAVRLINDGRDLEMVIWCERDWRCDWESLGWSKGEARTRADEPRYLFRLLFRGCQYFAGDVGDADLIYLNGRFKDSARLASVNRRTGRRHYHLRIQVVVGYIDIVFRGFSIRKLEGEIGLPRRIPQVIPLWRGVASCADRPIEEVRRMALHGDWLQKYSALQYLSCIGDPKVVEIALAGLDDGDDQVMLAAAFALGNHGGMDVLGRLGDLWRQTGFPLERRQIEDAMEKILERGDGHP